MCGVANRTNVDQGTWQECTDIVEVDRKAALDLAVDDTFDHFVLFESRFQLHPGFSAFGFLSGQPGFTETVFNSFQCNFDDVANRQRKTAVLIQELAFGNDALGLESGVDGNPVGIDVDNGAVDNSTRCHIYIIQTLFK